MVLKYLLLTLLLIVAQPRKVASHDFRVVATNITMPQAFAVSQDAITPDGSEFGGISGLAYDDGRDVYYALSDGDRTTTGTPVPFQTLNPRFYTMRIGNNFYEIVNVTYLKSETGVDFEVGAFQPRGIAYYDNTIYVTHGEGTEFSTGVWEYNLNGVKQAEFSIPANSQEGIFNGVAVTPSGDKLFAAAEVDVYPFSIRLTEFDRRSRTAIAQYVYQTSSSRTNLVDLIALDDNGSFMALESDASAYYALCGDASNVLYHSNFTGMTPTVLRTYYLATFLDGYEAMAMPPITSRFTSHRHLLLMTNNHFINDTQVLNSLVDIDTSIGIAHPAAETEQEPQNRFARDPAVWVHPDDPDRSLIIGTHFDGGLAVYNLTGHLLVNRTGDFFAADVIYAFPLDDGSLIDVVVVSTRGAANNTLAAFEILPDSPFLLSNHTIGTVSTIGPTLDIATYTSPYTGKVYTFVSHGQEVSQIELHDNGSGEIMSSSNENNTRILDISYKIDGMVVDREIGSLYVSLLDGQRIMRFDAEPDERDGDSATEIVSSDNFGSTARLRGLTMYYSGYRDGYLIVSVESDSTFAVFDRNGDHDYIGSFTVGESSGIDRTDATRGIDVVNINLGPDFECGAFFAQDNDNDSTSITNRNQNFKLVPYSELSEAMYEHLTIDTESWGPRRFALAAHIDTLSSQVYCALKDNDVSGRDAAKLLDFLADAARHVYPPATKKRQIMEPHYFVRDKHGRSSSSSSSSSRRHRHLQRKRCSARSNSSSRSGENDKGRTSMRNFINLLRDLRRDARLDDLSSTTYNYWVVLARDILENIPAELVYEVEID